jgi:hypothetical protein
MHPIIRVLAALVFAAATFATAAEPSPQRDLERLVRAFGAIEMFQARASNYLKVARQAGTEDADKTRRFMERVANANPDDLMPAFVQSFGATLSPSEVTDMTVALETPIGRKLIRVSIEVFQLYAGDVIAARDANPLSAEERKQLKDLGDMPGWQIYRRTSQDTSLVRSFPVAVMALPLFSDLR